MFYELIYRALEGLALLTSAICHDLDHRGTTNSFQMATESVLASLYSSEGSVMERHHLAQTLATLNIEVFCLNLLGFIPKNVIVF